MSGFKKGDRVLVEAEAQSGNNNVQRVLLRDIYGGAGSYELSLDSVHHHPGVPVADLQEECELAWKHRLSASGSQECAERRNQAARYNALRAAREAASAPEYTEGQEVWVRGTVKEVNDARAPVIRMGGMFKCRIHPDDIRTEEP